MNPKAVGTWYCDFCPRQNKQYFILKLTLDSGVPRAELKLEVDRVDERELNVDFKIHLETSGPFIALLAKDKNPPEGTLSMILKTSDDGVNLSGRVIWNSLTRGTIDEYTIDWTKKQSEENRNAHCTTP